MQHFLHDIAVFLLGIWGHFPILALTDDSDFTRWSLSRPKEEQKLRISFINLYFGSTAIHILSLLPEAPKEKRFQLLDIQQLDRLPAFELTREKAAQLERDYRDHLEHLDSSKNEMELETQALRYQIAIQEAREQSSLAKTNSFMTILLAIIPLLLAYFNWNQLFHSSLSAKLCAALLLYAIINLAILTFEVLKVRAHSRSRFSDLKNSENKQSELAWSYYFDWQNLKRKADLFVSYVDCCQEWICGILVLAVTLSIMLSSGDHYKAAAPSGEREVITIHAACSADPYGEDNLQLLSLQYALAQEQYEHVIVLYGSEHIPETLQNTLDVYRHQNIVWLHDADLPSEYVKIIVE